MKLKSIIPVVVTLVLGVAIFLFWNNKKNTEYTRLTNNLEAQKTEFVTYKSEVDGALIAKDQAILLLEADIEAALSKDSIQEELISHYKKLAAVIKVETVYKTDTVTLEVPIYIEKDTTVTLADACFKADLSLKTGLLSLNSVVVENRQDIVLGTRKNGLRKSTQYVDIRNTNPCITTTGMTTFIVVHEKRWWEKPQITVPAGILAGIIAWEAIR